MTTRPDPRDTLSTNLKALTSLRGYDQVQLAKRSGVNQKTISNILNTRNAPNLDKLELIAKAFGLNAWHLIIPGLPAELVGGGSIDRLFQNYAASDQKGRDYIDHVAEREATYKLNSD